MREIKQSTAANVMVFMADSTDHITGKTGLTLTVTTSKDGAAFGSITPTVTERGNGWYNMALVTGDTGTVGDLVVRATATGADPGERTLNVVANVEADTYGRVGAPAGASIAADLLAIDNFVDGLETTIGTAGAGLTALGDTRIANLDATTSSRLATTGYTAPDNTTIGTINTKLGTPASSVSADIAAVKTDTGTTLTESQSHPTLAEIEASTVIAKEATLTAIKGATWSGTTDSLEALRDRGDAAWITATGFALASDYTAAKAVFLDVAISSRLATTGYTAPDNTSIVFIQKWILNKLIEGPSNTWKLYDDDNTTVLKTWTWDVPTTTRSKAL